MRVGVNCSNIWVGKQSLGFEFSILNSSSQIIFCSKFSSKTSSLVTLFQTFSILSIKFLALLFPLHPHFILVTTFPCTLPSGFGGGGGAFLYQLFVFQTCSTNLILFSASADPIWGPCSRTCTTGGLLGLGWEGGVLG